MWGYKYMSVKSINCKNVNLSRREPIISNDDSTRTKGGNLEDMWVGLENSGDSNCLKGKVLDGSEVDQ